MEASGYQSYALELAFSVQLGEAVVGTFNECTGLAAEYETYDYAEGGNNLYVNRLVGRLKHPNVTLRSGVTNTSLLLDWVLGNGGPLDGRQNVTVTFRQPAGDSLRQFHLIGAVPVRWTGPAGNTTANAVATESLEIAHQGVME